MENQFEDFDENFNDNNLEINQDFEEFDYQDNDEFDQQDIEDFDPDFDEINRDFDQDGSDEVINEFHRMWFSLRPQLDCIYDENPQVNLNFLIRCYDEVYDYAIHVSKLNIDLRNEGQKEFTPGESHRALGYLYLQAISYIDTKASVFTANYDEIENLPRDQVLSLYSNDWRRFKAVHQKLQIVFRYLDRFYVPSERMDVNVISSSILEIFKYALKTWHDKIFIHVQEVLAEEIINKIRVERSGKEIDQEMVACASKSFIEIGERFDEDPLQLYKQLEKKFFSSTRSDYEAISRRFMNEINLLKSMTFPDYIVVTNEILQKEKEKVKMFMHESSLDSILSICEECLIKDHDELFNKFFNQFLSSGETQMIASLYELISRFPDNYGIFKTTFKEHIVKKANDDIGNMSDVLNPDPKEYVDLITRTLCKYETIVANELKGNEEFQAALVDAAEDFINENIVADAGNGNQNAKLLAKCCDIQLSTESMPESQEHEHEKLKESLEAVLKIVKFTNDKVGFLKFYEAISTPRIIFCKSKSNDLEDFMILQLQQLAEKINEDFKKSGTDALSVKGLKGISENLKASKDINDKFKALHKRENDPTVLPNFSVMVIDEKNWPYKKSPPYAISGQYLTVLPVLESTIDRFNKFYSKTYSGGKYPTKVNECSRKLKWLNNLGKGELNAHLSGKHYVLLTGAFQTAVLMAFNERDSYTFEELREVSGTADTPKTFLLNTMKKLFESKILVYSGNQKNIESKTTISLNINFQSKKTRISLETAFNIDDANSGVVEGLNQGDYENLANLATVRIFKRRRRMNQNELLYNLTVELKPLFKPDKDIMKRSITYCLKNSYIKVDENDSDFYIYIE